mmetsp:Transcript_2847/g.11312  ORF Transcript_2847/g.11312 Transcript_2847/m.11312 type:complete len:84 (+) Transcript_2847:176-427(+)|eukprot:CAMPEP_0203000796 /NCGR_PEP_ID=MMETSP1401-20130829/145_1 /ASSEMBLY_ACC=CAM_ASM_000894 /TAXON_ID=38833 /ORGANISM="Micromonas pusilla, Strain CCAC1681" /LENGTH=83 /DNA_ID=CAMNT_0049742249 /DNA_START=38 /DNA_END=289 /DNA_ORIENTATION=-
MSLQEEFDLAVEVANKLPKASNEDMLELYGWFKQANVGDVNTDRPGMFDLKGKAKWDAWEKCKGTSKEDAMKKYCEVVKRLSA